MESAFPGQTVTLGGAFLIKSGRSRYHIMPAFPPETELPDHSGSPTLLVIGSDSPVTPWDPWGALRACVRPQNPGGLLTAPRALSLHTTRDALRRELLPRAPTIVLSDTHAPPAQHTRGGPGAYLQYLPALSNPVGREDANFSQGWTAFYWAWWISWSPFVGMFIARVSRGRSVREFLVAVLLVPSLVSVLWMTAFGGTAINQLLVDGFTGAQEAGLELKLFSMLGEMPLTGITSFIGIVLVVVFFITSSDSGSLVIDTITAGGKVNAPVPQRVFWASIEGVIAIALLLGGGLVALQAMAVSTGLPFTIVLLVGCISIVKGLMSEPR